MQWTPKTRTGRRACWLEAGFVVWFLANLSLTPLSSRVAFPLALQVVVIALAVVGFSAALAGACFALLAIVRHRERAVLVFASLLPGAFALVFLLGELLVPH